MLDDRELKILAAITEWMNVNGEAIYGTRPWKISGQSAGAAGVPAKDASFNEDKRKVLTAEDVRFTTKGNTLYAFVMGWPEKEAVIAPLGISSSSLRGQIEHVELLGFRGKLKWSREEAGLKIELPEQKPCEHAVAFRISGVGLI
jgi:alpha-L-fucosidase